MMRRRLNCAAATWSRENSELSELSELRVPDARFLPEGFGIPGLKGEKLKVAVGIKLEGSFLDEPSPLVRSCNPGVSLFEEAREALEAENSLTIFWGPPDGSSKRTTGKQGFRGPEASLYVFKMSGLRSNALRQFFLNVRSLSVPCMWK